MAPDGSERSAKSRLALAGLLIGLLLAGLDITVVGTSLGHIVADIGGFELFTWLFAAYMLASTMVIPLAGKLADRVGTRPVYLTGMGVFLLGSALGGTAADIYQLIFYRAVQGLGGGMLFPVAMAAIADLYAPSERPKIQAALGAVFGFSSVVGPSLGGFIVDNVHLFGVASWRWVFYVNLPVGLIGMAVVATAFPRKAIQRTTPLDTAGLATLSLGLVSGLLITVLGGETYAWDSAPILGLALLSAASLSAFVLVERKAEDPILPFRLFRDRVVAASAAAQFFMGMGMFAVITFMPTYMQGVVGISATNAGAVLTPVMLSLVVGAVVSGRLMLRIGYKPVALAGTLTAVLGFVLLATLGAKADVVHAIAYEAVFGLGMGFTIETFVVAVQNVVPRKEMGAAMGSLNLLQSLGATLGVTLLGVVLTNRLATLLPSKLPAPVLAQILAAPGIDGHLSRVPQLLLQPAFTTTAPAFVLDAIRGAFSDGTTAVFLGGAVFALFAFAASVALPAVRLKTREEYETGDAPGAASGNAPDDAPLGGPVSAAHRAPPVPIPSGDLPAALGESSGELVTSRVDALRYGRSSDAVQRGLPEARIRRVARAELVPGILPARAPSRAVARRLTVVAEPPRE